MAPLDPQRSQEKSPRMTTAPESGVSAKSLVNKPFQPTGKATPPQWESHPHIAEGGVWQTPQHHQVEAGRVSRWGGNRTSTPPVSPSQGDVGLAHMLDLMTCVSEQGPHLLGLPLSRDSGGWLGTGHKTAGTSEVIRVAGGDRHLRGLHPR